MTKRHTGKGGFTLIEVMVALVVLTVGMGSVALAVQNAIGWIKETRHRQIALHLARQHFEYYRDLGYHMTAPGGTAGTVANSGITFTTIYQVTTPTNPKLKRLTLFTFWPNSLRRGQWSWVELDTYLSEPLHF